MARLTENERFLDDKTREYMRNKATLREVYAAADEVLQERGAAGDSVARSQVINESSKRTGARRA